MIVERNEIGLFFCEIDRSFTEPAAIRQLRRMLDADELRRLEAFRSQSAASQFLVSHAMLRLSLSRVLGADPSSLAFVKDCFGRSRLADPECAGISFSLSHTEALAACAVASDDRIGIDVEDSYSRFDWREVATMFADAEVNAIERAREAVRHQLFLSFWTHKEACLKAAGTGLRSGLRRFQFHWDRAMPNRLVLKRPVDGVDRRWDTLPVRLTSRHLGAVAFRELEQRTSISCWRFRREDWAFEQVESKSLFKIFC